MASSDYEVKSVILCDDVRREDSSKDILIGVYNDVIAVDSVPALLPLISVRFLLKVLRTGVIKVEGAITQPDGTDIVQFGGDLAVVTTRFLGVMSFRAVPMVFNALGRYEIKAGPSNSRDVVSVFDVITKEELMAAYAK